MTNIHGRKFPGYGRCIYCTSDSGHSGLRDEHVIPYALGGNAVIENASCKTCEGITSYLDGYLARHVYHDLRIHRGIQTRRPKQRPKELRATLLGGGKEKLTFCR